MCESQASVYTVSQATEDYGTSCADINNAKLFVLEYASV